MNLKYFILVLLLLLILIFLILININFKETFVCINPTKIDTDKICNSTFQMFNNKNFLNNTTTNGYIKVDFESNDIFKNKGEIYYNCLDNWDGTLNDFNKVSPDELNKNQFYNKLKADYNSLYNFSNLELYKCNKTCPPGKGIKDNSNICKDCDIDEYNMGDSYKCKKYNNNCPEFGYLKSTDKKTGIINCNPCYPGTYSDIENANNCKLSKPGYYVNKYGQSIEKPCELGTYSNTLSSKSCTPAEKGYYIDLTGQTTAKPCEFGTYSNTLGSKSCTPAEKGYYIDLTGQTTAKPCELGTYSNSLGNITCSPADIGYYVDDIGQITAKPCSIDKTTNTYGSKSINSCLPIFIEKTQWIYDIPGTYQWTCPPGIKKISVVAVGGGGGSGGGSGADGGSNTKGTGGGGGGLIWVNNINVKQGKVYTIKVGAGGIGSQVDINDSDATSGGDTIFIENGNELFKGYGGGGGETTVYGQDSKGGIGGGRIINIPGHTDYGGGDGGNGGSKSSYHTTNSCGGGGAGGYTGKGGDGVSAVNSPTHPGIDSSYYAHGEDGQGGGGGGGAGIPRTTGRKLTSRVPGCGAGGGVGIFGQGDNGIGGIGKYPRTGPHIAKTVSNGGTLVQEWIDAKEENLITRLTVSSGTSGSNGESVKIENNMFIAGSYGGGAGGFVRQIPNNSHYAFWYTGLIRSNGASGALRIIYNPEASFPSTKVSKSDYDITYYNGTKLLGVNTQWIYNIPGTYQWTCPSYVNKISVVAVGGGGGGGNSLSYGSSGAGGGGLLWVNNITVIPGKDYKITVGAGGQGSTNGTSNGQDGGDTDFANLLIAHGGKGGKSSGTSYNSDSGGNGGHRSINIPGNTTYGGGSGGNGGSNSGDWCGGGGGAGGYTGNGGNGSTNLYNDDGQNGQGGGGGGGAIFDGAGNAAPGGGVGIYGKGNNGIGGKVSRNNTFSYSTGKTGSGHGISGNSYGGGGGGFSGTGYGHSNGGNGALRIIYTPDEKGQFPSTKVSNSDYIETHINNILQ